jgi:hypothetical protein
VSASRREAVADWLMVAAGLALLGSLFAPWSHQLTRALLARYGSASALAGVPADPTAWQVYSAVDVLLALLAGALLAAALRGGRPARLVLLAGLAIASAFTVHALAVPPTNGVNLYDPSSSPPAYVTVAATAGLGETVALAALGLGLVGLLLSLTTDG